MDKGYYMSPELYKAAMRAKSQSTIKMEKGYYYNRRLFGSLPFIQVAIHNKNGKGLLLFCKFVHFLQN